ncbi:MAG: BREX-4 system phosphatase PglZ [bacterium]|nr:BREX-4 system phosphatase PglZ [Candidatus Limimorpha caballi]
MRNDFFNFEDLINHVRLDKELSGVASGTANRFPVRFVLFDNFQDSYRFVSYVQEQGCHFKNVNDWMDSDYPDTILTYSELSNSILDYAASYNDDCIITPFSELARFYNNERSAKEFDALVKTIKGIENKSQAVAKNRRIYIPIVGLEGKMSLFENDTQCTVWYLKNADKSFTYDLILTNGTTYGVNDLSMFNVAHSVNEWLNVWKAQPAVKPLIICTSPAIFANAQYAKPDNAFYFIKCPSAYKFLTKGLKLDFGKIEYKPTDEQHWQRLAQEITDIKSFSFEKFFNSYFHIDNLSDYNVFLKTWFECNDDFEKWLLTTYYNEKFCQEGYICRVINKIQCYTNNEFFSAVALAIFSLDKSDNYIEERLTCLQSAKEHNVLLSQETEVMLKDELNKLAEVNGYPTAIRYFSPLTKTEKLLATEWFAQGNISKNSLQSFFPDLYNYLEPNSGASLSWINSYFNAYKQAKLADRYTSEIAGYIKEKNGSVSACNEWYQQLKTTKTILSGRSDIDVYYWIDGLGVDWIPYIQKCLEKKQKDGIFLNEIHIARAAYPSTTEVNKKALFELSNGTLKKCGDLDTHAHKSNKFPNYILEELEIVNKAIETIVSEYNGKKIAIVSDHGLTSLSQHCDGLNLAGVESDHHGRLAFRKDGKCVSCEDYIVCDDEKTMCALNHQSLCGKVPNGQSAHGGCTPEEILVPIFVISSKKDATHWTATLQTKSISESNPIVRYLIKGITAINIPSIVYDGRHYNLSVCGDNLYQSEKISLNKSATTVELVIGDKKQIDPIEVIFGAEEDDLFNF